MTANDRGFTVIEIVVAITIFSVGILSLAATSSLVTRMVGEGHQYSEASSIANQRLELLLIEKQFFLRLFALGNIIIDINNFA